MFAALLSVLRIVVVLTAVNLAVVGLSLLIFSARAETGVRSFTALTPSPDAPPLSANELMRRAMGFVEQQVPATPVPEFTPQELARSTIYRRAVDAAIWGMPLVSVHAMREAFRHDAGAEYGDILYFSRPADWKFQTTTPNASSLYVYFNFNTTDGPVVLEFPGAIGANLFGSLVDAWETPLADVGPAGDDRGRGGTYLLLPPGYQEEVPGGVIPVRSETYNGYGLFRAVPASSSAEDRDKAIDLIKKLRIYPLSAASEPPAQRFIDIAGRTFDGIPRYDDTFFDRLAEMVNEEPVQTRDLVAMGFLRSLGIEKGRRFDPDDGTRDILKAAIAEAHAGFMHAATVGRPLWPGRQWILSTDVGPRTGFRYETAERLEIDERGTTFFLAYGAPKRLGAATFYTGAFRDAAGEPLNGDKVYRLRVPPNVPVKQYWAVTVYDLATAGFQREATRLAVDSNGGQVQKNADGSVDIYFASSAPPGKEANWIYTEPGKPWFTFFRFYGPEKAALEGTWQLPDIEPIGSASRALQ